MKITHFYLGLGLPAYENVLSEAEAHRVIGANTVAGLTPRVFSRGADGGLLTTPDGALLTVVTLSGSAGVISVLAFVWSL
ncbi:hypothetical protein ACIGHB_29915 [Streptomyces sp. NPDC085460]|uniref:hypothetical protein n=1 Tax=Streptomyces sp. NPDC085460 TaxID=3365723 RepID=UPI0037CF48E8